MHYNMDMDEFDKADETLKELLEIDKQAGHKEAIASDYRHLGLIHRSKGDFGKARQCWEKALALYKEMGMEPDVEKVQRWIDELPK